MRLYEITKINKNNSTGKRLGVVRAVSRQVAVNKLSERQRLPKNVRVFPVKLVKSKNKSNVVKVLF